MNDIAKDTRNLEQEQREQREQSNIDEIPERSPEKSPHENEGNKSILMIENPSDTEPTEPIVPSIVRPCFISHSDWFEIDSNTFKPGLYHHFKERSGGNDINVDEWICSPLEVLAITSSAQSTDFGRLLRFLDSNGKWHEWAMPMHMLKSSSGDELCGELLDQGLVFDHKNRRKMINYIMSQKPKNRITAASTIGWHNTAFVLPDKIIGAENVVYQSEIAGDTEFTTLGSLQDWKDQIGKYCEGNIPLVVSISTCLAGPLLKIINRQQGGGVHWVGDSSTGKSTALETGATVWGPPEFIRSWCTTSNGFEGIAAARNDTCIILDEINEAPPHEVGKIVYMLTNGQGKQRASRIGSARKIQRWRLMAVSSGEKSLENIINETGRQVNSGQIVRLLNIPANFEHGVFSNLHGFSDGRSLADHLKSARLKYYGHIGPEFISKLINETRALTTLVDKITQKFVEHTTSNLEKRAASIFSVIALAGELGIEYGLLPWKEGSALDSTYIAFKRWREFQGVTQTEDQKILQAISAFIDKHGDSRFSSTDNLENKTIHERAGWYKNTDDGRLYMFTAVGLQEAASGYERKRIIETLVQYKWLTDNDNKRYTKKTRIGSETKNLYHVQIPYDKEQTV